MLSLQHELEGRAMRTCIRTMVGTAPAKRGEAAGNGAEKGSRRLLMAAGLLGLVLVARLLCGGAPSAEVAVAPVLLASLIWMLEGQWLDRARAHYPLRRRRIAGRHPWRPADRHSSAP